MSPQRLVPVFALALLASPAIARGQQATPRPPVESAPRLPSRLDSFFGLRTLPRSVADTTIARAMPSTCPMLVARPDTTRLERMPRARVDSARMAPMPVAHGCVADAK